MMLKKEGLPEDGELVLCTVSNVQHHSVFVRMDEYDKTGMIHISEVSPGRIRNIRDFVKEGRVVVCKVIKVNKERGHVDLSLRRVTEAQRRAKIDEIKHQGAAEKIVEFVAKKLGIEPVKLLKELSSVLLTKYESLYDCFQDVIESEASLEKLGVSKKIAEQLNEVIKLRIKPAEVEIKGNLYLKSVADDGVNVIKNALKKASEGGTTIKYIGAGKYSATVRAPNYQEAEKLLKASTEAAISEVNSHRGEGKFERIE